MKSIPRDRVFKSKETGIEYCVPGGRLLFAEGGNLLVVWVGPDNPYVATKVYIDDGMVYLHTNTREEPNMAFPVSPNLLIQEASPDWIAKNIDTEVSA